MVSPITSAYARESGNLVTGLPLPRGRADFDEMPSLLRLRDSRQERRQPLHILAHVAVEIRQSDARRVDALQANLGLEAGILARFDDVVVKLIENGGRRLGRRQESVPSRINVIHAFGHGGGNLN